MATNALNNHDGGNSHWEYDRLSKNDACMLMAIWMEMSPLAKTPEQPIKDASQSYDINKVGVVAVDANGKLFAADCSHEFAHGIMSVLLKFKQRLAKSIVFVSRKPCYDCTKHMIQAGVKTVYYFPVEPEVVDEDNLAVADHIFKVSHIAIKAFIPRVRRTKNYDSPFAKKIIHKEFTEGVRALEKCFGQDIYQGKDKTGSEHVLSVSQVPDTPTRRRRQQDFLEVINWLARTAMGDIPSTLRIDHNLVGTPDALKEVLQNYDLVRHTAAMTHILSHRTDDPTSGVGAVLMSHTGDYLGFGYNGYQLDAEETDFPGVGDKNEPDKRKVKFSYIVHAETNALLFCNKSDFDSEKTLLLTTKMPCNHCTLYLRHLGIRHVIIPDEKAHRTAKSQTIGYGLFDQYCEEGHFAKYVFKEPHVHHESKRHLSYEGRTSDQPEKKISKSDKK